MKNTKNLYTNEKEINNNYDYRDKESNIMVPFTRNSTNEDIYSGAYRDKFDNSPMYKSMNAEAQQCGFYSRLWNDLLPFETGVFTKKQYLEKILSLSSDINIMSFLKRLSINDTYARKEVKIEIKFSTVAGTNYLIIIDPYHINAIYVQYNGNAVPYSLTTSVSANSRFSNYYSAQMFRVGTVTVQNISKEQSSTDNKVVADIGIIGANIPLDQMDNIIQNGKTQVTKSLLTVDLFNPHTIALFNSSNNCYYSTDSSTPLEDLSFFYVTPTTITQLNSTDAINLPGDAIMIVNVTATATTVNLYSYSTTTLGPIASISVPANSVIKVVPTGSVTHASTTFAAVEIRSSKKGARSESLAYCKVYAGSSTTNINVSLRLAYDVTVAGNIRTEIGENIKGLPEPPIMEELLSAPGIQVVNDSEVIKLRAGFFSDLLGKIPVVGKYLKKGYDAIDKNISLKACTSCVTNTSALKLLSKPKKLEYVYILLHSTSDDAYQIPAGTMQKLLSYIEMDPGHYIYNYFEMFKNTDKIKVEFYDKILSTWISKDSYSFSDENNRMIIKAKFPMEVKTLKDKTHLRRAIVSFPSRLLRVPTDISHPLTDLFEDELISISDHKLSSITGNEDQIFIDGLVRQIVYTPTPQYVLIPDSWKMFVPQYPAFYLTFTKKFSPNPHNMIDLDCEPSLDETIYLKAMILAEPKDGEVAGSRSQYRHAIMDRVVKQNTYNNYYQEMHLKLLKKDIYVGMDYAPNKQKILSQGSTPPISTEQFASRLQFFPVLAERVIDDSLAALVLTETPFEDQTYEMETIEGKQYFITNWLDASAQKAALTAINFITSYTTTITTSFGPSVYVSVITKFVIKDKLVISDNSFLPALFLALTGAPNAQISTGHIADTGEFHKLSNTVIRRKLDILKAVIGVSEAPRMIIAAEWSDESFAGVPTAANSLSLAVDGTMTSATVYHVGSVEHLVNFGRLPLSYKGFTKSYFRSLGILSAISDEKDRIRHAINLSATAMRRDKKEMDLDNVAKVFPDQSRAGSYISVILPTNESVKIKVSQSYRADTAIVLREKINTSYSYGVVFGTRVNRKKITAYQMVQILQEVETRGSDILKSNSAIKALKRDTMNLDGSYVTSQQTFMNAYNVLMTLAARDEAKFSNVLESYAVPVTASEEIELRESLDESADLETFAMLFKKILNTINPTLELDIAKKNFDIVQADFQNGIADANAKIRKTLQELPKGSKSYCAGYVSKYFNSAMVVTKQFLRSLVDTLDYKPGSLQFSVPKLYKTALKMEDTTSTKVFLVTHAADTITSRGDILLSNGAWTYLDDLNAAWTDYYYSAGVPFVPFEPGYPYPLITDQNYERIKECFFNVVLNTEEDMAYKRRLRGDVKPKEKSKYNKLDGDDGEGENLNKEKYNRSKSKPKNSNVNEILEESKSNKKDLNEKEPPKGKEYIPKKGPEKNNDGDDLDEGDYNPDFDF